METKKTPCGGMRPQSKKVKKNQHLVFLTANYPDFGGFCNPPVAIPMPICGYMPPGRFFNEKNCPEKMGRKTLN